MDTTGGAPAQNINDVIALCQGKNIEAIFTCFPGGFKETHRIVKTWLYRLEKSFGCKPYAIKKESPAFTIGTDILIVVPENLANVVTFGVKIP